MGVSKEGAGRGMRERGVLHIVEELSGNSYL